MVMSNPGPGRALAAVLFVFVFAFAGTATARTDLVRVEGLTAPVKVTRDSDGIAHIRALRSRDLYFMQGYVHAEDRLFQMDLTRRQPSGTLAELLGPRVLGDDVEARTIGLRRAAERSLPALTRRTRQALEAYADGVNRWVEENDLPPEYDALNIGFEPWTPVDSVVIAKAIAFSLSFDLDTGLTERFTAYAQALGPEIGAVAFSEDVFRSMPFDCASTVPDATGEYPFIAAGEPDQVQNCISDSVTLPDYVAGDGKPSRGKGDKGAGYGANTVKLAALASAVGEKLRRSGFIRRVLDADGQIGSNEWGVTRRLGANGLPVIANDPHLSLDTPSTFYPIGLRRPGMDVFGSSFAGVPFVVLGVNRHIQWGATTNPMDVTDAYVELLGIDEEGFYTLFRGAKERVVPVPEAFYYNDFTGGTRQAPPGQSCGQSGIPFCDADTFVPEATLIVPRRNNGPIVGFLGAPPSAGGTPVAAVSVQYTGFSATRELDTFRLWNESRNLRNFQRGLQFFDFGSQNWVYADVYGNMAYFASAEMPIRKDLQAGRPAPGTIEGVFPPGVPIPPWFLRDGTSGEHEWLGKQNHYPGQAIPYEILAPDEMPHTINPPKGYFVNANNDPAGTTLDNNPLNQLRKGGQGIYYLNPSYAGGFRAGTITLRLRETLRDKGEASLEDMQRIQADVTLLDARYFVPLILQAWERASADGAGEALADSADDDRLREAVGRLADWDFSTPTGLPEGYDAGDDPDDLPQPSEEEIANSIAATIYSVWRGQAIREILDSSLAERGLPGPGSAQAMTALKNLFDNFETRQGFGVSGIDFFSVDGVIDRKDARDIKLLGALQAALDKLAGPDFVPAFAGSEKQQDYRWGRLHTIVLNHPFVPEFDIPSAISGFPPPFDDLRAIPTDGGFGVVDASSHSARADEWDEFDFGSGPVRRFVGEPARWWRGGRAESIWAGGTSGVPFPGNPFYSNLLPRWLVNETVEIDLGPFAGEPAYSRTLYLPERRRWGWWWRR